MQQVYAGTRQQELACTGWPQAKIDDFLVQQCNAQHQHYRQHFAQATFELIKYQGENAGRLYVDRSLGDIRIVDIALLDSFRGKGIGSYLLKKLLAEGRDKGLTVSIHVEKNNPARRWYERLGFLKIEDKGLYDFMQRTPEEAINEQY